jgi:hypothetical protein
MGRIFQRLQCKVLHRGKASHGELRTLIQRTNHLQSLSPPVSPLGPHEFIKI